MKKLLSFIILSIFSVVSFGLTGCKGNDSITLGEDVSGEIVQVLTILDDEGSFSSLVGSRMLLKIKNESKKIFTVDNDYTDSLTLANESGEIEGEVSSVGIHEIKPGEEGYAVLQLENEENQDSIGFMIDDNIYVVGKDYENLRQFNSDNYQFEHEENSPEYNFENDEFKLKVTLQYDTWDDGTPYVDTYKYSVTNKTDKVLLVPDCMAYSYSVRMRTNHNLTFENELDAWKNPEKYDMKKEDFNVTANRDSVFISHYLMPNETYERVTDSYFDDHFENLHFTIENFC